MTEKPFNSLEHSPAAAEMVGMHQQFHLAWPVNHVEHGAARQGSGFGIVNPGRGRPVGGDVKPRGACVANLPENLPCNFVSSVYDK